MLPLLLLRFMDGCLTDQPGFVGALVGDTDDETFPVTDPVLLTVCVTGRRTVCPSHGGTGGSKRGEGPWGFIRR